MRGLVGLSLIAIAGALEARIPLLHVPPPEPDDYFRTLLSEGLGLRVIVKFMDHTGMRASENVVLSLNNHSAPNDVRMALQPLGLATEFVPVYEPGSLDDLLARAEVTSGRAQPDLYATMELRFPSLAGDTTTHSYYTAEHVPTLTDAVRAMQQLDSVEFAYVQVLGVRMNIPVQEDAQESNETEVAAQRRLLQTGTPNFQSHQRWRGADPGMEIDYANSLGATGRNIRHNDCEYCWIWDHEDITVAPESGFPCHSQALQYADHGTASSGCAVGRNNNFGVLGAAVDSPAFGFSEYTTSGYNRPRSITAAARNSRAGDIVLLEMQNLCCGQTGNNYSPAETDSAVFQATRTAVDAGVVVIAAAGNGNQNLDGTPYATWRGWGNSGAVIIGAGTATTAHNRASFSSFGARVNVQAWGDWSVMTGGYGPPPVRFPGDTTRSRLYTATFSGTSSASALAAAAAASMQSYSVTRRGRPLTPAELRTILVNTGIPQTGTPTGNIGPHINLRRAFAQV